MSPLRYAAHGNVLVPDPGGQAILFSDVEEALHDRDRFAWILPVICGENTPEATSRTHGLAAGLLLGKRGVELVDYARGVAP